MINVSEVEDFFEPANLKTISQFSYILLGKKYKDNASNLNNFIVRCPELTNSSKLQMTFFHTTYSVNDEFSMQKCLVLFRMMKKKVRKNFLVCERLPWLVLISSVSSWSAERSFSLCAVSKNYSHSTMTQVRFKRLLIFHIHKDEPKKLCHTKIEFQFIYNDTQWLKFVFFKQFQTSIWLCVISSGK